MQAHAPKRHSVLEVTRPGKAAPGPPERTSNTLPRPARPATSLQASQAIIGAACHHSSRRRPCKKQCDECCIWKLAIGSPHPEKPRGQCVPRSSAHRPAQTYIPAEWWTPEAAYLSPNPSLTCVRRGLLVVLVQVNVDRALQANVAHHSASSPL